MMQYHEPTDDHPRAWYSVDKAQSLVTTCQCIKYGLLRFFKYDYESADSPGLLHDFLALIEEKSATRLGSDNYIISKNPNQSDDFAQAVNIGCCALWWMTNKFPDIAEAMRFKLPPGLLKTVSPSQKVDWQDM